MTKRVRIEGLREVNKALGELPKRLGRPLLIRVGRKRLEPMRDAAKANAPVDEQELRDSIIISTRQRSGGQRGRRFDDKAAVEVMMGPSTDEHGHAIPQEFGSENNPPSGYMRKAWDAHSGGLLNNLASDLGQAVDQAAKRLERRQSRKKG